MTDEERRERKRERNRERMRRLRQDPEYLEKEREYNRRRRQDPEYREKERERMRRLRQDPEFVAKERERYRRLRQDPEFVAKERERKRKHMRQLYHENPVEAWFRVKCGRIARAAVEERIGRKLRKGEEVHHINGRPWDNRDENLQLCTSRAEHMKFHRKDAADE